MDIMFRYRKGAKDDNSTNQKLPPSYDAVFSTSATNPICSETSETNGTAVTSPLGHINPIDPIKFLPRKMTSNKHRHEVERYRCQIHKNVLFRIPKPAIRPKGRNIESEIDITGYQEESSNMNSQNSPQSGNTEFEVKSSTLELLISVARSSALFSAARLKHRTSKLPLVAHQIYPRQLFRDFDDGYYLIKFLSDPRLQSVIEYQKCLQTCKDATAATIHILQEALKHYENDPDILWSLWLHQSVSFACESKIALETLASWSHQFRDEASKNDTFNAWDEITLQEKMKGAQHFYDKRIDGQPPENTCECTYVNLAKRTLRQRFIDLIRGTKVCDDCKAEAAKPPWWWIASP
ncbi:hypothetical protein TWF694_006249 [Orbilia ellipsospora]|uniref:Uncharacterized protein n=1 Tax=Orbilia ellipsospora TaxID=2528407 RepID=A0AAV9XJI6_9PEZI